MGRLIWLVVVAVGAEAGSRPVATTSSAPTTGAAPVAPLARAKALATSGRYAEALSVYDAVATEDPAEKLAAAIGAASVMELTGRYRQALGRLDAVRAAGQADAGWQVMRARLLTATGQYDQAVQACRAALALDAECFEARCRCARLYEITGRRDRALRLYAFFDRLAHTRVPERPDQLVWHGRGFYRHSLLTRHANLAKRTRYVLHELFQPAYEVKDPRYWPARIASAELLLSKYNLHDAEEDFKAALAINPNLPAARAGLANIALEKWRFEACEKHLEHALEVNPNHILSRNVLTRLRLTERKYPQAAAQAERTLQINPNDLEALSLAAAAHVRLGDAKTAVRYERRVAEIHPRCALLHHTVAEWLAAARQFPEAEQRYRRAIELDAGWSEPQTALGLMYMQWGREQDARQTLDAAWQLDRFNRKTYNVLQLLEQIEGFERTESAHFVVKLDANQDGVLVPYFVETLESIWPGLCRDYDYTPTDKTIIEVFPSHRAFSVRITSRPWIHTIGASTGRVIAMDAPRHGASITGPFDWGRVLRHELTHTVTLAATRNRIPHWLTEALAVRQEGAPMSFRWMGLLSRALRRDRLFTLETIDWSFVRPKRPGDREQAYAQSRWMADFIVAEHGYESIGRLLALFRAGKVQSEVIRAVCGVDLDGFGARFRKWATEQVRTWGLPVTPIPPTERLRATVKERPEDPVALAALAEALLYDGKHTHADHTARRALKLDANNVRALTVRCAVLMGSWRTSHGESVRQKLADEANPLIQRLARLDAANLVAPRFAAQLAMDREDLGAARPWLERLRRVSPHDPVSRQGFAALYLEQGRFDRALAELTGLAPVNEHDPELPLQIASLCGRLGREAEAARWLYRAVKIDPYDAETHEQLAALSLKLGKTDDVIREYRALCELQPTRSEHFARLAVQYKRIGKLELAKRAARRAVELDPDSPVSALLRSGP